jgi:hypothetical protein
MKLAAALMAVSVSGAAALFKQGPPVARTGGFGEPTCMECHLGEQLNAPGGVLEVSGVPPQYEPGRDYLLTVRLQRNELAIGGFELAARFEAGPLQGRQAGRLRAADQRVFVADSAGVQYAHHTLYGVTATGAELRWRVHWRAPTAAAPVIFHIAGNAANDDASNLGDFIYTASARSTPRSQK